MKELRKNHPDCVTSLYLSGNPGCGKTQLARLLGDAMYVNSGLSFVFTLYANSSEKLYESMFDLALRLEYNKEFLKCEVSNKDTLNKKFSMLCTLVGNKASSSQPWLLIVDGIGVSGVEKEMKFWRNPGIEKWGAGQVIITTQQLDDIPFGDLVHHESLQSGLDQQTAVELLKKVSGFDEENGNFAETVEEVAKELDYQPLALVLAAIYTNLQFNDDKKFTWRRYLEELKSGRQEPMEDRVAKKNVPYSTGMVAASRLVVGKLAKSCEILKHIFLALSFCSNSSVPVDLLASFVSSITDDTKTKDFVMTVKECCLLMRTRQYDVNAVKVHQVIHDGFVALRYEEAEGNAGENLFSKWLDSLEKFAEENLYEQNSTAFTTLALLKSHIPNFQSSSSDNLKQTFSPPVSNISNKSVQVELDSSESITKLKVFCHVYSTITDTNHALNCNQCILRIQRTLYEGRHPEVAETLHNLGLVYLERGDLENAEKHNQESLAMKKFLYGESHPDVANTLNELGLVYKDQGNLEKAEQHFLESLEMKKPFFGESHPDVAGILQNLGVLYHCRGDLEKAEQHHRESLAMKKILHGKSHPEVADTLHNLGLVYKDQGDLEKAEQHFLESLAMKKAFFGESHPDVAVILSSLGSVCCERGDLEKAEKHYLESLSMHNIFYGESHPDVAGTLNDLGLVYLGRGNLEKAEQHFLESLEMTKIFYGESHPEVADTLHNLGLVYKDQGDLEKAEQHFLESLAMKKAFFGESHPDVAVILSSLGSVCCERGDLEKAEKHYLESLSMHNIFYGESHPDVAGTLNDLGLVYLGRGNLEKAEQHFLESLEMTKIFYGENHPKVATMLHNLGLVYKDQGDSAKAEQYFLESLAMNKIFYGESHPEVANTLDGLGVVYEDQGDSEKAEQYFLESLGMKKAFFGESHPSVALTLHNLELLRSPRRSGES